jgi:hypothetical protein
LFTQPGHGFHLHVCEDRRPVQGQPAWSINSQPRKNMLIGFVKLFYIFEHFLFSLFPKYRSSSQWCRSYQSIFNFNEIRNSSVNVIWDVLTGANNIIAQRQNGRDYRYISLNFKNCRVEPDGTTGIGTIEFRIGHSTFDSEFIQAYINLIQNLFNFNLYLDSLNPDGNPCGMQNILMELNKQLIAEKTTALVVTLVVIFSQYCVIPLMATSFVPSFSQRKKPFADKPNVSSCNPTTSTNTPFFDS